MGRGIETFQESPVWVRRPELGRVRQYVLGHLAEEIDLARGARIAGLDKSTFCTSFRRSIGVGFPEWVTRVRVDRAVELLEARDLPVRSVSRIVGFGTLRTFQRSFKKITGITADDCKHRAQ